MTLEEYTADILQMIDNDSSRNLCADLREYAELHGEAEAVMLARGVRAGIQLWAEREERMRQLRYGARWQ
jgi:hypothetical protein